VNFVLELLGKLFPYSASLFFWATQELLKWQNPIIASSELLVALAMALRTRIMQTSPQSARG